MDFSLVVDWAEMKAVWLVEEMDDLSERVMAFLSALRLVEKKVDWMVKKMDGSLAASLEEE